MNGQGVVCVTFSEQLNDYMEQLACSARELGDLGGISAASLSRYRSGARVPALETKAFEIYAAPLPGWPPKIICRKLRQTL